MKKMDLRPKDNEELRKLVRNGVLNCEDKNLICDFNIDIEASIVNCGNIKCEDIKCWDINCKDINCHDIDSCDINSNNIKCHDINCDDIICYDIKCHNLSYHAICIAYQNITCNNIKARRKKHIQKAIDGKIKIRKRKGNRE